MDKTIIIAIVITGIGYVFGILTPLFKKLVKKTKTNVDDIALDVAIGVVKFVENSFGLSSGESKKQRAIALINQKLGKYNILNIDVDKLIEKALTITKMEDLKESSNKTEILVPTEESKKKLVISNTTWSDVSKSFENINDKMDFSRSMIYANAMLKGNVFEPKKTEFIAQFGGVCYF